MSSNEVWSSHAISITLLRSASDNFPFSFLVKVNVPKFIHITRAHLTARFEPELTKAHQTRRKNEGLPLSKFEASDSCFASSSQHDCSALQILLWEL